MSTHGDSGNLPEKTVTIDQVIAHNVRYWRRKARMTQKELGQRIGWSYANLSAAELSADDGKDKRRFDAQTITEIALAVGVPVTAMFIPPEDDGTAAEYVFTTAEGHRHDMGTLVENLAVPSPADDSPLTESYRERFNAAATAYLDPEWAESIAGWLKGVTTPEGMADRAARLRERRAELLRTAAELDDLASAIDRAVKE